MESNNKLAVLDRKIPLRAFPEQDLNKVLLMDFMPYLTRLLSLTDEVSANRLEVALPAIKEQCWGMGFVEIKKMFELYVDNKLAVQPIPNYFDRILFGKIVKSYMQQKPKVIHKEKLIEVKEETKKEIMGSACKRVFKQFKEKGKITDACNHVYDYLFDLGKLPTSTLYKDAIFAKAKMLARQEAMKEYSVFDGIGYKLKETLDAIEIDNSKSVSIAKRLVLEEYFSKIDEI